MIKLKCYKILLGFSASTMLASCLSLTSCNHIEYKYPEYSLLCMGDSITYGLAPNYERMALPYPTQLRSKLSFGYYYNYGVNSSTVTSGSGSVAPMVDRVKNMKSHANIIVFWGGVNDFMSGRQLGSKGDKNNECIYGALNSICQTLTEKYPSSFKMFITPLPTTRTSSYYSLLDVREAIQYTCDQYAIPVLDLYTQSGFEEEMTKPYSDGIHPSQDFVTKSIVPKIYDFIKNNLVI